MTEVIGNYNVLPFGLENIVAITLPILELFIGCCLIFGIMLDGSAIKWVELLKKSVLKEFLTQKTS